MDKFIRKINTSPLIRKRITAGDNSLQQFPKTFGVSLKKILEREDFAKIPNIVSSICEFLILYGLETEGLFRVNGNTKAIESIKCMFEENYTPSMSNCTDVHAVASVLKLFLRELPEGIVPESYTTQLFEACQLNLNDLKECVDDIINILISLPMENYNLLKYICKFLVQVVEKESYNKMDFKNLGIVFGPNIFRMNQSTESFKMQTALNAICTYLISNYDIIFKHNYVQRDVNSGFALDTPLVTQTISTDGHKSSPSLSGDFDLSSSNDNHICPAPLPSISTYLQNVITSCVNSHVYVPAGSDEVNPIDIRRDTDIALMDEMLPDWQGQTNMIDLDDIDNLLADDNNPLINPSSNYYPHDEAGDLDGVVHDYSSNRTNTIPGTTQSMITSESKEPVHIHNHQQQQHPNYNQHSQNYQNRTNSHDIYERMNYLKAKLNEFEENFERQHGCKPQIERTGNLQVQEWLAELMSLREKFHQQQQQQSQLPTQQSGSKSTSERISQATIGGNSSYTLVSNDKKSKNGSKPVEPDHMTGVECDTGSIRNNVQPSSVQQPATTEMSVTRFFEYLNEALQNQRVKSGRPVSLSDMSKEQLEDEKVDLQKCLLHFEKLYGRPHDLHVKQIMKPLYDRYRTLKRYVKSSNNMATTPNTPGAPINLSEYPNTQSTQSQQQQQHPIASGRTRSLTSHKDDSSITAPTTEQQHQQSKVILRGNSSTNLHTKQSQQQQQSSPQQTNSTTIMTQSCTVGLETTPITPNNNPNRFWRPYSTTGASNNWRTTSYYDDSHIETSNINKQHHPPLESSNTNSKLSNNQMIKPSINTNKLLKSNEQQQQHHHQIISSSGCGAANINATTNTNTTTSTTSNNENITSCNLANAVSSKSFNTTNNDLIPFRSCGSMNLGEMQSEREKLLTEKRRLQKLLKDFEHGLERMTGRRIEKSDRDHMRPEYDRYKTIKCRIRLLDKEIELRSRELES